MAAAVAGHNDHHRTVLSLSAGSGQQVRAAAPWLLVPSLAYSAPHALNPPPSRCTFSQPGEGSSRMLVRTVAVAAISYLVSGCPAAACEARAGKVDESP